MTPELAALTLPCRANGDTEAEVYQDNYIGVARVVRSYKILTQTSIVFGKKKHLLLLSQAIEVANRYVTTLEPVSLRTLTSLDLINEALAVFGITWEFLAYLLMFHATKLIPGAHAAGTALELDNPLHGLVYWHIVLRFLLRCVKDMSIVIPGLSTSDAVAGGLSSFEKVLALAEGNIKAMTAACTKARLRIPDLDNWFFQKREFSSDDSGSDSGSDTGSERRRHRQTGQLSGDLEGEDEGDFNEEDGISGSDDEEENQDGDAAAAGGQSSQLEDECLLNTTDDEEIQGSDRRASRKRRSTGESSSGGGSSGSSNRRRRG